MAQIQDTSSQPQQPTRVAPNPPPSTPPIYQPPTTRLRSPYLLALLMFILGIIGGVLLFVTYPKLTGKPQPATTSSGELSLPKDAVEVQKCVDSKGALFVRPKDIPQGPVYMVYKNKIIGLEYKIDQNAFFNGKAYKNLASFNIRVNHIGVEFIPTREGWLQTEPFIDLYLIDAKTEQAIICEKTAQPSPEASPSADLNITPQLSISPTTQPSPQPITTTTGPSPSSSL